MPVTLLPRFMWLVISLLYCDMPNFIKILFLATGSPVDAVRGEAVKTTSKRKPIPGVLLTNDEEENVRVEVSQTVALGQPVHIADIIIGSGGTATFFFIINPAAAVATYLLIFVVTGVTTGIVRRYVHAHWVEDGDVRRTEPRIQWGRRPGSRNKKTKKS